MESPWVSCIAHLCNHWTNPPSTHYALRAFNRTHHHCCVAASFSRALHPSPVTWGDFESEFWGNKTTKKKKKTNMWEDCWQNIWLGFHPGQENKSKGKWGQSQLTSRTLHEVRCSLRSANVEDEQDKDRENAAGKDDGKRHRALT